MGKPYAPLKPDVWQDGSLTLSPVEGMATGHPPPQAPYCCQPEKEGAMRPDYTSTLHTVIDTLLNQLGDALLGVYLYGSTVESEARPYSDIDILVIISTPTTPAVREALIHSFLALSTYPPTQDKPPLEITLIVHGDICPWHYPPRKDMVYGEWLRNRFEQGIIPPPAQDADVTILLAQARNHHRVLFGKAAESLLPVIPPNDLRRAIIDSLPQLLASITGDERNVLLTLARMWVTLESGHIVSKDAAAHLIAPRLPHPHADMLYRAGNAYLGNIPDDWNPVAHEAAQTAAYLAEQIRKIT